MAPSRQWSRPATMSRNRFPLTATPLERLALVDYDPRRNTRLKCATVKRAYVLRMDCQKRPKPVQSDFWQGVGILATRQA